MIWCKGFTLWNLVTGVSGLRVGVIWEEDRRRRRQAHRWRTDIKVGKEKWKGIYYVGRRTGYSRMKANELIWKMSFEKGLKGR